MRRIKEKNLKRTGSSRFQRATGAQRNLGTVKSTFVRQSGESEESKMPFGLTTEKIAIIAVVSLVAYCIIKRK